MKKSTYNFSHRFLLIFLLFLLSQIPSYIYSMTNQPLEIDIRKITSIHILGNNKTKSSVILRELKTQIGDTVNVQLLEEDYKRILNLNLFERVTIEPVYKQDGVTLLITVYERWYIIPYPIFFINERNWKHLSYGLGIYHTNFRGRAELLSGSFWAGYNPCAEILYHNP